MAGVPCEVCGHVVDGPALSCPTCGTWISRHEHAELAGRVAAALGSHYRVDEAIGRGGYAMVFRVRDLQLERDLAAKTLHPELAAIRELTERFRHEARTAAQLNHPNIVPIFFVVGDETPCLAMPLIEGESLAARLKRERQLATPVALAIARDLAAALDYAHGQGFVHRDVKPDNVIIELATGRGMLTDFGIAKALANDSTLTASGVVVGTPHYMSPEQISGDYELDPRSDVYSLGVVLFEMLAGAPPFQGANVQSVFSQHLAVNVPSLLQYSPGLRDEVDEVLRRALAKTPADRFETAGAVVDAFERAQGGASLRRSGGAVIERQRTDDIHLFRTLGTASGSAAHALRDADDVAAMSEAVNAIQSEIRQALEGLDVAALLDRVALVAERANDPRPALRHPVKEGLRRLANDAPVIEALAGAWRAGESDLQGRVEQVLGALLPEAGPILIGVAERAKSAEFFLLADRIGALEGGAADALANSASPAVAQAFGIALRESVRPRRAIEHWLALLSRHPHPGVRSVAIETASTHGGGLGERVARLLVADGDASVRQVAVRALGASRRREALPDLTRVLERGTPADQCVAAEAMGALGLPEVVPTLERVFARRRLFRLERGIVQRAAAGALAALPERLGTAALARLADHPDPEVQRIARSAR